MHVLKDYISWLKKFINIINMKKLSILFTLLLLAVVANSAPFNVIVSGTGTTSIDDGTLTISTFPYNLNFPVPEAKWIWNQDTLLAPANQKIVFFHKFKTRCDC